jgi:hypothetical protein
MGPWTIEEEEEEQAKFNLVILQCSFQTSSQQITIQLDQQQKHQKSYRINNTWFPEYL